MTDKDEAGPVSGASEAVPQPSTDAILGSNNPIGGGTESACNDLNNLSSASLGDAGTSTVNSDRTKVEKLLELADELVERGSKAVKDGDYAQATDCFSRALEIRATHYGELAPECVNTYYKYGCALLYKAQEEADPLGSVPKKDTESQEGSTIGVSAKNNLNGGSSSASISSKVAQEQKSDNQEGAIMDDSSEKDEGEDDEDTDNEDIAEVDDDESDLDLAWKMLDIARAIVEKNFGDTMEKVDILSALAEVALEREDIETSLSDYLKALSILKKLVEPDNRQIAELNFRVCLCLEIGSKPSEAIPYCRDAISICKSRGERLTDELKALHESVPSAVAASDTSATASSNGLLSNKTSEDKAAEIETLNGLITELEKKAIFYLFSDSNVIAMFQGMILMLPLIFFLIPSYISFYVQLEDLQQFASNPSSVLTEILGMVSAKAKEIEKKASSAAITSSSQMASNGNGSCFDSPTVSTAHTSGPAEVTHLGVVGRGVKRVNLSNAAASSPMKKPALDKQDDTSA
ncbi:hypothetical protein SAY86_013989 [Trapa natans]|uniref:Uncharacterized protein n=1 Tax=Trapa natans TaxID=22666 RepID=A0AAN7KVJ4_TRANT|nr:hypothetical protein SAY86_013989 [Trapa natans]